jgi:hypothetical protein
MNPLLRKLPLMRTCKEVTAILVAREDRDLATTEEVMLRLHMAMCKACPNFERQILTMRNAMKQWRNYGGDDNDAA